MGMSKVGAPLNAQKSWRLIKTLEVAFGKLSYLSVAKNPKERPAASKIAFLSMETSKITQIDFKNILEVTQCRRKKSKHGNF